MHPQLSGVGRRDFRADINGLRGIAVALVVAFHLQWRGADGGFIGVDVFFVISGYLMTKIILDGLHDGSFGYWRFVGNRAARIWPALACLVGLLLLFGAVALPPFDLRTLAEQASRALVFWSNHFFHDRSGYNTKTVDTHWLLHTWSLSVEWQFYMLYPLVLAGLARLKANRWQTIAVAVALMLASLADQIALSASRPVSAVFLLPGRAWEMLAGGLVFLLAPVGPALRPAWRAAVSYAGLALLLIAALWLGVRHVPPEGAGWPLVVPVLATAVVLWAHHEGNRALANLPLQKLGLWSYSIYLWHWPLIVGLRMTDAFLDHPRLAGLGVTVASVVCGALSFRFVESVSGAGWRRLRKPLLGMGMAAAMTALAVATGGLQQRDPGAGFGADYAASVKAAYFPDRCSNFMKTAAQTRVCEVPKSTDSRRRILVIGDSHAEYLYAWFVAHSQVPVDFFTQAECPPVPHFERMQNGFHCGDYAAEAWKRAASDDYDTLVLASRWAGVGLDGAPYCHAPDGAERCVPVDGERKQALVREELASAIRGLLSRGKTVVMLEPTPEARVRVPERILREQFWYGETRLTIDERSVVAATAWLAPLFEALKGQPGFHLVSLNDKLCAKGSCRVYDTQLKRPIYIDDSHLDPLWMAANGGVFAPFASASGVTR